MQIADVREHDGKIFGTIENNQFRPLLTGGAAVRDLRQVIALVSEGGRTLDHGPPRPLGRVRVAAPVGPLAKNVICVGKNYHDVTNFRPWLSRRSKRP
jgi:hypothetical protein